MAKTAFVAGADNALGVRISSDLLKRGFFVFAAQIAGDTAALEALARQYPERLTVLSMDVTSLDSVEQAKEQVAEKADHIDLLVHNIDYIPKDSERKITDGQNFDELKKAYDINALGPLRVTAALIELLDKGELKRICTVSSVDASINGSLETANYGHAMAKAALNMQMNILFNRLRPEGYTFRLYGLRGEDDGNFIVEYFLRDRSFEPHDPKHSDENRIVMRDRFGREIPW